MVVFEDAALAVEGDADHVEADLVEADPLGVGGYPGTSQAPDTTLLGRSDRQDRRGRPTP